MWTCLSKILITDVADMPYLLPTSVNVAFGALRSLRTLNTVATESFPPKVKGLFRIIELEVIQVIILVFYFI